MGNPEDLSGFISNTRSENLATAKAEALRIHAKIDFKKYISEAISENETSIAFSLKDATRVINEDGYFDDDDGWENEYIHSVKEQFAGEQTWSHIWKYLIEIVESQGISCRINQPRACPKCLTLFDRYDTLDSDGDATCRGKCGWVKPTRVVTGLKISWE